jgi:hypothetical protein
MKFKLNNSKEELEFSKELIEKWVFEKKAQNFYKVFYNGDYNYCDSTDNENDIIGNHVRIVYDMNYGDGNDYYITFHFVDFDFYVSIEGYYSSYDSAQFNEVYFSKPYEYKEIRYEKITV